MVSKASDSTAKLGRSHGEQSDDSSGSLTHKMHQLKKQIQGERIVSIKEKIERNGKKLERYVSDILSVTSRTAEEGCNGKLLSSRIEQPLYKLSGLAQGYGDKDHVNSHDVLSPSSTKLPYVEKLPPYTTWIFLERNQRMADDQSVVGRRRIYYDNEHGSEALICSDSEEDVAEPEEVKREFTSAEDKIISTIFGEFGISEEVVNAVSNFIGADSSEVQEKYNAIKERNQQKQDSKGSGKFGFYKGISLDKSLMAALDSFDKLFCRRCKQFDCHQHGCSQRVIYPSEKQAYWSEHDEDRKPCSEHCYLKANFLQLRVLEHLPKASNANLVHEKNDTSDRENNPASEAHSDHANKKVMNDEICAPAVLDAINTSEVADRSQNVDTSVMAMHYEDKVKRKAMEDRDSNPDDLERFCDYIQNSCKKQKSLTVSDVESRTSEHILTQNGNSSAKSGHLDVDKCATNETPMTTKNSGSASCDEFGDKIQNELDDTMQVDVIKQPSRSIGQVQAVYGSSEWKQMEKDLYMKGLEIFGRNSCLIARNLLSGLKTCLEVSMYMYEGGVSVPHRSAIGPSSSMEDNGKTDTEHTDHEMATKSRLIRRRGKARKLKYSWKSAGPPSIWKRIADGKTQSCNQYTPCSCESMCGRECTCMQNGTCCEKYCRCSKSCKNRFRGCHCAKSQCRSRQCPCFAAGRECDPDVCRNCWVSCGDGSLEEPPRQGDGHCGNMRLLLKQQQKILLAKSDVAGWGAFLKNPVNKNDYLGEYTGELISHREADKRGKIYDRANSSFLFDLNDQYVLDAYRKGDKLKFANHSSNPNCYAKVMLVAGDHRVGIFAKERIEASEELFYDYRYGPDQAPAWARRPESSKRDDSERPQGSCFAEDDLRKSASPFNLVLLMFLMNTFLLVLLHNFTFFISSPLHIKERKEC